MKFQQKALKTITLSLPSGLSGGRQRKAALAVRRATEARERASEAMERVAVAYESLYEPPRGTPPSKRRLALRDHIFPFFPSRETVSYRLGQTHYGPFRDLDELEADFLARLKVWDEHAQRFGGWVWRQATQEVVVTLPFQVPLSGYRLLPPWASSAPA
jgi:hypothetical protein